MEKLVLLLGCLIFNQFVSGQSIQEICEMSNTNGTIVDCQHFDGALYSTGFFDVICGGPAGYVAQWQNGEWTPATWSISDPGHALNVINDKLYIAKYEESIDSNWVYVYDNTTVEKVGQGVFLTTASGFSELPNIYDIIEYDGKIVACGEFDRVGKEEVQGIMQWDGNKWSGLGLGLSGNIRSTPPVIFPHQMMVHNSELYVVGNFAKAGGQTVNGIAKWNGSNWVGMGAGFDNTVYSIAVFNDEIIVGGSFTESNGTVLNRIAKWDGSAWAPLEFGFTQPGASDFIFVHTIKAIDSILYIGGGLKEIFYDDNSIEECNGIVSYSNNSINTFNGGVPDYDIEAICKFENDQIIVGGGVFGNGYAGLLDLSTSIDQHYFPDHEDDLVYPTIFDHFVSVRTENEYTEYAIVDSEGVVVRSGKFEYQIDVELPTGFYFLKLISDANSYSIHKIIRH